MVLVAVLPILVVALVVVVARRITTVAVIVAVIVAVLITLLIVERPLFAILGTVSLPTVRTIVVVLFAIAFAIFATLFTGRTVLLVGR